MSVWMLRCYRSWVGSYRCFLLSWRQLFRSYSAQYWKIWSRNLLGIENRWEREHYRHPCQVLPFIYLRQFPQGQNLAGRCQISHEGSRALKPCTYSRAELSSLGELVMRRTAAPVDSLSPLDNKPKEGGRSVLCARAQLYETSNIFRALPSSNSAETWLGSGKRLSFSNRFGILEENLWKCVMLLLVRLLEVCPLAKAVQTWKEAHLCLHIMQARQLGPFRIDHCSIHSSLPSSLLTYF